MTGTQQQEPSQHRAKNCCDDEIELIDILRVIWKWRYLILVGTLLCGLVTGIINYNMPKIFSVKMLLQPGVLRINEDGTKEYLDNAQHIKATIETGIFDNDIRNSFGQPGGSQDTNLSSLKAIVEANSNVVKVMYATPKPDFGVAVLENLGQSLSRHYKERLTHLDQRYQKKIEEKTTEISLLELEESEVRIDIKNIEKRIAQLRSEIEFIGDNTKILIEQRQKVLSDSAKIDALAVFVYGNVIQENLSLKNNYEDQIYGYTSKTESLNVKLRELQIRIEQHFNEMRALEEARKSIQPIQIIQPPIASSDPIKPKKALSVMLATIVGLCVMTILAFFLQYVSKHRGNLAERHVS